MDPFNFKLLLQELASKLPIIVNINLGVMKKQKTTWVEIASTLPQQLRTNVDCKDKWRNLMLNYKERLA
ncbi:hypothetical protein QOT17_023105 [Balamuthia mandrillaris]